MNKLLLAGCLFLTAVPAPGNAASRNQVEYKLTIRTPNIKKAGTDATVNITIFGSKGRHSLEIHGGLYRIRRFRKYVTYRNGKRHIGKRPYYTQGNRFEKGSTDVIRFTCADLGTPSSINVSHNNAYGNPGWYLGDIVLEGAGKRVVFPCHRWLATSADDRKISRRLLPEAALTRYLVKVYTGSRSKAGTDARVRIDIEGTTPGCVSSYQLDCPGDPFEKGSVDAFNIYSTDLGDLKLLRAAQDGTGSGSGWFLNKIEVFRINKPRKFWRFRFERWLDGSHGQSASARPE